jgi:methylene-tetrahydromethanopterin dehydrogenase
MSDARILHFLMPLKHPSPFDVNVAVDAGFTVAGYTMIGFEEVTALTQNAMFSRVPQDAAKACLFIGGRDAPLALNMTAAAKAAMFRPSSSPSSPTPRAPSPPRQRGHLCRASSAPARRQADGRQGRRVRRQGSGQRHRRRPRRRIRRRCHSGRA